MAASNETIKASETSLLQDYVNLVRYYLRGRRGLIILAAMALGAGAFFNWGWLVAIGAAPLLLALAPCAAMCALGLCMRGGPNASCATSTDANKTTPTANGSGQ